MRSNRKTFTVLMAILLIALIAAGCGGSNGNGSGNSAATASSESPSASAASPSASSSDASEASFPLTIHQPEGDVVIPEKPKTVAVTYFPYADHLFAIGDETLVGGVVGMSSLRNFAAYQPYLKDERIADLGDETNLEKLLALKPDVIIAWEYDEKMYDELSKIAPTVVVHSSENWEETIKQVADVVGDGDKAQQYIDGYRKKLEEAAEQMEASGMKGKTAIFMMTWEKGFNYYDGVRMKPYYDGLGFKNFDSLKDYGEIDMEGVSELNPDYIFLGQDFTKSAETTLAELAKNPVWNRLNAVRNKKLYVVDTEIMGPLAMGQSKGLDYMESLIKENG
ncbi:ABC transporter substrate-binding protein [Cohnella zeiphila]|uniref:ABC transporter substrate-binding protein n=1 Tax=Cohnella zeiphila TaxID=2761120 RepID=A0A7X0SLS7_9BACL|nr:ABC transporter substrate-binding protein [Cohnella zeiphila]MBB6731040.1 ABC transporter substrate-binding protein [Cohnella zeiphila]